MRGRPRGGRRRRFNGEITYYHHHRAEVPIRGGAGGHRMITLYAAPLVDATGRVIKDEKGRVEYGPAMNKTECRADAARQGKRATFVEDFALSPRQKPPTPLECAERRLSEEQLAAVQEIWAKICEQERPFRALACLDVERLFHEEAVEAVKAFYAVAGSFDQEASTAARKRLLAVGAAMAWLRLKLEGSG